CPPLSSAPTIPRPPRATLFPYTTLFRSRVVYTTNGGSTWSSEVTVDTGVSIGAFVPALQISARTYGKAWTFAYSGGTARVETMRVTTTNGASWSALTNVYDDDGLGGGLVIPYADITETIA